MITGLYAAATGLMALEKLQSVIANNIANASTPGFRRQVAVQKGFQEILLNTYRHPARFRIEKAPGGGVKMAQTYTDVSNGVLATTGDPLNIGLVGPGLVAVTTPAGDRFTRNGDLSIDVDGQLATSAGFKVQNAAGGYITVRGGAIEIDERGTVIVDGLPAGQIRVVEFEDPHMLTREGGSLYAASDAALQRSSPAANTRVVGKALEMSNVQLPYEIINMMMGLRAYAANQRVINSLDETVSQLIERVGTPV